MFEEGLLKGQQMVKKFPLSTSFMMLKKNCSLLSKIDINTIELKCNNLVLDFPANTMLKEMGLESGNSIYIYRKK